MKKIFLCILVIIHSSPFFSQISDEELLKAIRHDETSKIDSYFRNKANDPNRNYGKQKVPLMHYAASINKTSIINQLIDAGADLNSLYTNDSPLMIAIYYGHENTARLLIKKGANIDLINSDGRTAAIEASRHNKAVFLKILHDNGADFTIKDNSGKTAIDYAYQMQHIECYEYLCKLGDKKYEELVFTDYFDGPYVFWQNNSKFNLTYLINDSVSNKMLRVDSIVNIKKGKESLIKEGQLFEIPVRRIKKVKKTPYQFPKAEKIMAIGDLHGEFNDFSKFLINNKVIDSNYDWTFGKGHLVLAGDIFDRGETVNECFWLLYKLETEADKQGGKVHFVLGNHEIMQISGDKRYLAAKYLNLFNRLRINYTDFYGDDTELGRWLRTKNTIIKINDILFVHGGLSKELVNKELNLETINNVVREIISRKMPEPQTDLEKFLLGNSGPLWYRGYIKLDNKYYKSTGMKYDMTEKKLDEILKYYNASAIVFANTHVKEISPMFNFKLYGIDIPFAETKAELQGLYIEDGHFYKALFNGNHVILH